MFDEAKIEWVIGVQSRRWFYRVPEESRIVLGYEDLLQEARIRDLKLRKGYNPQASQYSTYLWLDLECYFMNLISKYLKRNAYWLAGWDMGSIPTNAISPERGSMVLDFIDGICDFAEKWYDKFCGEGERQPEQNPYFRILDMLNNGVPSELKIMVDRKRKGYRYLRGWKLDDGQFILTKHNIEVFFDVRVRPLRALYNNCL
jgi:hypothetical protein